MIEKDANRSDPVDLRRQAEEQLRKKPADFTAIPPEEAGRLLHELQVHQIELEMQNEELRRAQKELAASRVKYFDLYDMAPVGYFTVSEKGLILEANLTADILLGVVQRALAKEFLTRFILTEDQDIYYRHNKQLFKTGEPHACELRMVKKDGIPFWARLDATVAQGVDGAPVCRVVLKDITERKRAEEETRVLAKFPSENPDPIMRISTGGTLLYINESGSGQLSEWNLQVGKIIPPLLRDAVSRVLKDGSREILDLEYGESTYSFSVMPVRDAGYANLYGRNITERKRAEEALAQSLEQLRQSQKIEAVGRLAGGIAHDFNNLVTVIIGYCELMAIKVGEKNPLWEDVQEINKAADRAAALTRQLLAFSRRQILQPKVLEIDALVPEMDKMLRRLISEDINLVTNLGAGAGKVKVDPGQIEQVIVNLVINSRDAMPDGGTITIETANVELDEAYVRAHGGAWPGPHVMLAVSDTGSGMDAETLSKAFEPFFTTKEKGKGIGMGLSTVYGIVKQSGGCLYIYSEPGRGTTMKIYLPRVTGETAPKDERQDAGFDDRLNGSETILLVEDEETLRKLASSILEGYGYTVLSAGNGEEALQLLNNSPAISRLLVTDVVMPKMGGRELSDRIKAIHPGTQVLFMSGYTDNAIVHHGVLDQGVSYLPKPFTPKALARKVREVLDKK